MKALYKLSSATDIKGVIMQYWDKSLHSEVPPYMFTE